MNDIKLIVMDLDGTLLNDKKEITVLTKTILKKCKERGIKLCLASGRYDQMMSIYDWDLEGVDYILSCNGAFAKSGDGTVIYSSTLEAKSAKRILEYCYRENLDVMVYTDSMAYYTKNREKLMKRMVGYEKKCAMRGMNCVMSKMPLDYELPVPDLEPIQKIVAYVDEEAQKEFVNFCDLDNKVYTESTGYGLMAAFNQGISKKYGIEEIKKNMGITSRNVMVFGDFDNDISMFDCSDYSVCMINGSDTAKSKANYITELDNNHDGIADFLVKNLEEMA